MISSFSLSGKYRFFVIDFFYCICDGCVSLSGFTDLMLTIKGKLPRILSLVIFFLKKETFAISLCTFIVYFRCVQGAMVSESFFSDVKSR